MPLWQAWTVIAACQWSGGGDEHAVNVLSLQYIAIITIGFGLLAGVFPGRFEAVVVAVAYGGEAHLALLLEPEQIIQVGAAHAACADQGDDELAVGAGLARRAQDASLDNIGKSDRSGADGGGDGFKEIPSGGFSSRMCHNGNLDQRIMASLLLEQ